LVLYGILYLEHTVWCYMLYCIWKISSYKSVCTYCIAFKLSLHIKTWYLYNVLYFGCIFIVCIVVWAFIHIKMWVLYVVLSTSLQIKDSTSKLQKLQCLTSNLVFISVTSAEGKNGAIPPTSPYSLTVFMTIPLLSTDRLCTCKCACETFLFLCVWPGLNENTWKGDTYILDELLPTYLPTSQLPTYLPT
jgi:hypothetical protein